MPKKHVSAASENISALRALRYRKRIDRAAAFHGNNSRNGGVFFGRELPQSEILRNGYQLYRQAVSAFDEQKSSSEQPNFRQLINICFAAMLNKHRRRSVIAGEP